MNENGSIKFFLSIAFLGGNEGHKKIGIVLDNSTIFIIHLLLYGFTQKKEKKRKKSLKVKYNKKLKNDMTFFHFNFFPKKQKSKRLIDKNKIKIVVPKNIETGLRYKSIN